MSKFNAFLACLLVAFVAVFCVSWYGSVHRPPVQCPRIDWDHTPEIGPYKPEYLPPITDVIKRDRKRMYAALQFERTRP